MALTAGKQHRRTAPRAELPVQRQQRSEAYAPSSNRGSSGMFIVRPVSYIQPPPVNQRAAQRQTRAAKALAAARTRIGQRSAQRFARRFGDDRSHRSNRSA